VLVLAYLTIVDCPAEVWYGTNGAIVGLIELKISPRHGTPEV